MSVAAVMLVRDEADVIETTLRHLLAHVDEVLVADNGSTDGTYEIIRDLSDDAPVRCWPDVDPAYRQSEKTTALAERARLLGHEWVIPCDADEIWYVANGGLIREWLARVPPEIQVVNALWYTHVTTSVDDTPDETQNVIERMRWRRRDPEVLAKVAARLRADLVIDMGNHYALHDDVIVGPVIAGPALDRGLAIRHFPARSPEQYLRKVRAGAAACAAAGLDPMYCAHWRQFDREPDDAVLDYYGVNLHVAEYRHPSIVYDPAPVIR